MLVAATLVRSAKSKVCDIIDAVVAPAALVVVKVEDVSCKIPPVYTAIDILAGPVDERDSLNVS